MAMLVTGGTGHVGGKILRRVSAGGRSAIAVHRGTSAPAALPGVTWVACDLADSAAVAALARAYPIDACIHAAAVSNEAFAKPEPLAAIGSNMNATAHLLDAARVQGWRRFVLVSTGSVFQRDVDPVQPILEDAPPRPVNVYGSTKAGAELLVRMYREVYALSAAAVRISWVFGPPVLTESPTRGPIPSMTMRVLRREVIREGGGDFAASFTFVEDVAEGLLAAVDASELRHPIYHLGSGCNFTARDVADALRGCVPGAAIDLTGGTDPWTRYTAMRGPLSGDRFHADTGFTVRHTLAQGIAKYVAWMRSAL